MTGYGVAARRLVRGMADLGAAVELDGWNGAQLTPATGTVHDRVPTIVHLVPENVAGVRRQVPDAPVVSHTVWETDRLPAHWPDLLQAVDLVVVPTEWNRDVFARSGVSRPIAVVPHVAWPDDDRAAALPGELTERLGDRFVFYVIGRWDQRKALDLAVEAYLAAFTAEDPVALVVKTTALTEKPPVPEWGTENPKAFTTAWQVAHLVSRHRSPAAVHLEAGEWTDTEIRALHRRGDCYVSLARGEGWGLGAFDAATQGNPVIASGWGGHLAYLEGSELLVGGDLVPVRSSLSSYTPDQRWLEPDLEQAIELLRAVVADPAPHRQAAGLRSRSLAERFDARAVARTFLEVVP